MSTKRRLGLSFKTGKTKSSANILFLTIIIATILLLGRTFIPVTNVLAEIMDGTPGNDVLSGSKVSITAVNGYETQLDDFIYGDNGDDTIYGQDGSNISAEETAMILYMEVMGVIIYKVGLETKDLRRRW